MNWVGLNSNAVGILGRTPSGTLSLVWEHRRDYNINSHLSHWLQMTLGMPQIGNASSSMRKIMTVIRRSRLHTQTLMQRFVWEIFCLLTTVFLKRHILISLPLMNLLFGDRLRPGEATDSYLSVSVRILSLLGEYSVVVVGIFMAGSMDDSGNRSAKPWEKTSLLTAIQR